MKIGLLQLNSTVGDFTANREKLVVAYAQAVARGAEFIFAPKLFLCGYPPRDLLMRDDFIGVNLAALEATAMQVGTVPLCAGFVEKNSDRPGRALKNSAAVLQHGKIVWRMTKSLLPTYDVFDVAMSARYSSSGSLADAKTLAKNIGIRYEVLPIETAFNVMEKQLEKVFTGTKPNEAEENIPSRLRGVTLMALSNKFGALVLTTGNKSEMAVGYCTLCGTLAPIADVLKTDVYKIARRVNRERRITAGSEGSGFAAAA